jgi:exopolysaccharide biosynthesis protein
MVDSQGNLNFLYAGQAPQGEELRKYIEDNEIRFSISFGPVLIDNGVVKENEDYPVGEIIYYFSRAALCQMDELHYLVATANKEKGYPVFPNLAEFAAVIAKTGCPMAYTLDGGQTATMVMNDQLMNRPSYDSERDISDIIYFATAIPNGE